MGKVLSSIKHPFRNFNLESRAHKIISQPKPKLAPKHAKDQMAVEKSLKEYPEAFEQSLKKDPHLDKYLKDVYVVSHDSLEIKHEQNPEKPLPLDRTAPGPYLFGFKEPNEIPRGKTTLRMALQFISQHQEKPNEYTISKISKNHSLPVEIVKHILDYYRVFEIYIPKERSPKAKFAGPSVPKVYIIKETKRQLPEGNSKKDNT